VRDDLEHQRRLGVLRGVLEDAREELLAAAEELRGSRVDDEALDIALGVLDDAARSVVAAREELAEEEAAADWPR
jgi:hypothetical protein